MWIHFKFWMQNWMVNATHCCLFETHANFVRKTKIIYIFHIYLCYLTNHINDQNALCINLYCWYDVTILRRIRKNHNIENNSSKINSNFRYSIYKKKFIRFTSKILLKRSKMNIYMLMHSTIFKWLI